MGQSDLCYGEWRLPPPSWPSQMTVLHSVRWTFLAAGAGFLLLERPPKFPGFGGWHRSGGEVSVSSDLSSVVPKWGLMEGRRVGVLRWAEQNGAALFEMFSYLILYPSKGSSLIRLAWPCSCHCSTAYPVQLMISGAACHASFSPDRFQFTFQCPVSEAYTSFFSPFLICLFIFVFVVVPLSFYVVGFVLPVFMED